ncbi:ankyrin repeat-containing domain, PGG domain, Gag-polypeptide of LTR copia-type [Artemisia annua]|uniref:Ankyrin repeat-containing domain, PGG domain, Gag-polypeptide of LTR copia-type n=1 Tax=Artemisia annua TaxID=35608 RepID=A0A2U1LR84_ARTAN|nr:ankyrin repeat-containing domain, PGG domain, Gag-polypeptide of LTR copia-type [Artemisia annua]
MEGTFGQLLERLVWLQQCIIFGKERNNRLFNNCKRSTEEVFEALCEELRGKMTTITVKQSANVCEAEELWNVKFQRKNVEQMTCLLESHDMLGFLHGNLKNPQENGDYRMKTDKTDMVKKYREWKRSDTLVKGWIFGSLTEGVMGIVVGLQTANQVWIELNKTYSPIATTTPLISTISHKDQAEYIPLYRAILRGQWEKAQEIFIKDIDAFTTELNGNGYTALHLAIGTCDNIYFVENLLKEINAESLSTVITDNQSNALHRAAAVGNTKAAKLLVQKNPHLLFIVVMAILNSHLTHLILRTNKPSAV